jgi:hypothetical protein
VHRHFAELREKMCVHTYKTERGVEYACHPDDR